MTYRQFIDSSVQQLSALYPMEEAKSIAVRLLTTKLDIQQYKYLSEPDSRISSDKVEELNASLEDLLNGRPLQYVLGSVEFAGIRIKVKEGVLIPRPETEELFGIAASSVPEIIGEDEDFNILDLCTGSGCLAYAFAATFPGAGVYGCDISNEALKIASKQKVKGAHPVLFWADLLGEVPIGLPKFDVIVSNPPYVLDKEREHMRKNVLDFEPELALFVPDDDPLKFYKAIARWSESLLKPDGQIYLEINESFGSQVSELFPGSEIKKDIFGKDRFCIVSNPSFRR